MPPVSIFAILWKTTVAAMSVPISGMNAQTKPIIDCR